MKNRSKEEIDAILQTFPDVFEDLTQNVLTQELLKDVICELLKLKEREIVKQRFFDFSPRDLRTILKSLDTKTTEDVVIQALKVAENVKRRKK